MSQSKILSGNINKNNIKLLFTILILSFAGLLRFSLLFTAHQYPSGDESLAGVAAQLSGEDKVSIKTHNFYYAAAPHIEEYLIAVVFKYFGVSDISLKSPVIFLSLISLFLVVLLGFEVLGNVGGIIWGIIYGFCSIFAEWNLVVRAGYIETLIFIPFLTLFLVKIYEKKKFKNIVILGIISAIAFWNQPIILPLLIAFGLLLFLDNNKGFLKMMIYISIPILLRAIVEFYRSSSGFMQQYITSIDFRHFILNIIRVFHFDLPAFFSSENVDNFVESIPVTSYLWYVIIVITVISMIIRYSKIYKSKSYLKEGFLTSKDVVIFLFFTAFLIHIILYSLTTIGGTSPRYLLPVGFYLIALVSFEITRLINLKKVKSYIVVVSFFFLFVCLSFAEYTVLFQEERTVHDLRIISNGKDLIKAIDFLKANDYKYVYANYFLQWRIIFESKSDIIASSDNLLPMVYPFPKYENAVDKAKKYAYVVNTQDPFKDLLLSRFSKVNVKYKIFDSGDITVIHALSKNKRPKDIFK
ncbi:MAG: glycosyltransferase family 39 protein [Elusimicrobia bacterium]|nr:glycosyltransferase family 39 protein [Elusimicrobiota bacterium]